MDHPLSFDNFQSIWRSIEGAANPHDAYDAYLGGVSEALQQAACTCDLDSVHGYVDRITAIVFLRRDHKQGTSDSSTNLGRRLRRTS